jgi:hypothetical protein
VVVRPILKPKPKPSGVTAQSKTPVTRSSVMARLKELGLPVLPVAPAQDAQRYPAKDRQGNILRDQAGQSKAAFTGKNPSFLGRNGEPKLLPHRVYQDRMPHAWETQLWFANTQNGVMTMGGWNNIIWIDIDVKRYPGQGRCDRSVEQWMKRYPILRETWIERTHSGGWRFAVQVEEMPDFTNFGFRRGQHLGEILGKGRLTVLAPTIGPSGKPYVCINQAQPIRVTNVAVIGLKPAKAVTKVIQSQTVPVVAGSGEVAITDLVSQNVSQIINGGAPPGADRSNLLTAVAKELYGWVNWCAAHGLPLAGQAEVLMQATAEGLGIDVDRVTRILESIDQSTCQPAMIKAGGEVSGWRRIKRLNWDLYRAACPQTIQQEIRGNLPKAAIGN